MDFSTDPNNWKVFICHDSKDKIKIVDPLVNHLKTKGSLLWYDKISIPKGRSIDRQIHKGLKEIKVGVVIFSHNFIKERPPNAREYCKEEFYVLVHKEEIGECYLLPVFCGIDPQKLPESFKGPLDNKSGIVFKKGGDTLDLAQEILGAIHEFNIIDNTKRKEEPKRKNKALYFGAVIALILTLLYFITEHKSGSSLTVNNYSITPIDKKSGKEQKKESSIVNDNPKNNRIPEKSVNKEENFSDYINQKEKVDISVTIIDDKGKLETPLSNSITGIYINNGKTGNIGLLRNSFIRNPKFQELFEGNSDVIEKLKLKNYTDYLVLGKINYTFNLGREVTGTVVCNAFLNVSIISTANNSIKSFTISDAIGNGVTESQAQEFALRYLLSNYKNNHSSL